MSLSISKHTNKKSLGNMYILSVDNDNYFIVDPCIPYEEVKNEVQNKNCLGAFLTHAHYDHFCEIESWLAQGVKIYLSEQALSKLQNAEQNGSKLFNLNKTVTIPKPQQKIVGEGDKIELGKYVGSVIYIAGHTDCSIGLIVDGHFFCGDFIFAGGNIGRYDLPTGSSSSLRNSLRRLRELDENLIVHSGHGEDFILKNYKK